MFNPWDWINASPYRWGEIGLILDITGGFFVSVEAIGLDNLQRVHDKLLLPIIIYLRITKESEEEEIEFEEHFDNMIISGLVSLMITFISVLLYFYFSISQSYIDTFFYIVAFPLVFIIFLNLIIGLGVAVIRFVENNTQKGVVGILGFSLLFFGFAFQWWSDHLQSIQYLHTKR